MATRTHVLRATDIVFKAFLEDELAPDLPAAGIVRSKEVTDKESPILICASENAMRGRAKNYTVTGSLTVKTFPLDPDNQFNLDASDALELALLDALEQYVPDDDRPQPLAAAIQAAAAAAGVIDTDKYLMNDCRIMNVTQGFDEDSVWTFSVDYSATVIFAT